MTESKTISGLLNVTDKIAHSNVEVTGEALRLLGNAFGQLSETPIYTFKSIVNHLQPLLKKTDETHQQYLMSFFAEVATVDLPSQEKAQLYSQFIKCWNEQVKQEKSIWGDLAKISAKVAGGVVLIASAALAVEHSRPKTMGDAANKLIDRWGKG